MSKLAAEVKTRLGGLKAGMFVSRLDIPWIETSFLLEGLMIRDDKDIESLREACHFVYIDTAKGDIPDPEYIIDESDSSKPPNPAQPTPVAATKGAVKLSSSKQKHVSNKKGSTVQSAAESKPERGAQDTESKQAEVISRHSRSKPAESLDTSNEVRTRLKARSKVKKSSVSPTTVNIRRNLSDYNGYMESVSGRRKITYRNITEFTRELKTASTTHDKLSTDFQSFMGDLEAGRDLDISIIADGIRDMTHSIIRNPSAMSWVALIRRRDKYSYSRALGTSVWCATFGRHLGLEKTAIETLTLGGLMLDLGKSLLPIEFLQLKRTLSHAEFQVMKKHVQFGLDMLHQANWGELPGAALNDIKAMVEEHHERADGSGYPHGLENDNISFFARMAGIVDSFDAMTSERPYVAKGAMSPHRAVNELYDLRGSKFQAELVEQFIQTVGIYPAGSLVELNTGQVGMVIAVNSMKRLRPTIMLILDKNKKRLDNMTELALGKGNDEVTISHGLASGAYGIDPAEFFI